MPENNQAAKFHGDAWDAIHKVADALDPEHPDYKGLMSNLMTVAGYHHNMYVLAVNGPGGFAAMSGDDSGSD